MGDMADYEQDAEEGRDAFVSEEREAHKHGYCGGENLYWFCDLEAGTLGDPDLF